MRPVEPPRLIARFETDERGAPSFLPGKNLRHYKIVLEVENPPPDAYAATFELDPTYYDPVRTISPDHDGKFRLEMASYGDYPVTVKMRTKQGEVPLINTLSQALENAQQSGAPAITEAISYIANH